MEMVFDASLIWWIGVVEIPVAGGIVVWLMRRQRSLGDSLVGIRERFVAGDHLQTEALSQFRLEAACTYATTANLRESENRLTRHLQRMESKLDELLMPPKAI